MTTPTSEPDAAGPCAPEPEPHVPVVDAAGVAPVSPPVPTTPPMVARRARRGLVGALSVVLLCLLGAVVGGAGAVAVHGWRDGAHDGGTGVVAGSGVATEASRKRMLIRKRIQDLCGTIGADTVRALVPRQAAPEVKDAEDGHTQATAECSIETLDSNAQGYAATLDITVRWFGFGQSSCESFSEIDYKLAPKAASSTALPELGKYGYFSDDSEGTLTSEASLGGCKGSIGLNLTYRAYAGSADIPVPGARNREELLRVARAVAAKILA